MTPIKTAIAAMAVPAAAERTRSNAFHPDAFAEAQGRHLAGPFLFAFLLRRICGGLSIAATHF
jgi:hypothetical protein